MATFAFTGNESGFSLTSPSTLDFSSISSISPTNYRYLTTDGRYVTFTGYDFTIDVTGRVTGGTVTAMAISHDGISATNHGLTVTGLNFDAVDISGAGSSGTSDVIFNEMLVGSTTISMTDADSSSWGADGYELDSSFVRGGDNTVTGDNDGYMSLGFVDIAAGNTFQGGDSTFNGSNNEVFGDAARIYAGATLVGGDDRIIYGDLIDPNYGTLANLSGDGGFLYGGGNVVGGDDIINARAVTDTARTPLLYGDLINASGITNVVGGDDRIYGSATVGSELFGDVDDFDVDMTLVGGDDSLYGGSGNDIIQGDVGNNEFGDYVGGDDIIYGRGGVDLLYGQKGNDRIYVGSGASTAYGGGGDDYIKVLGGNVSAVYGGSGEDRVSFATSISGVTVQLGGYVASRGLADDVYVSNTFENISGSSQGDDIITGVDYLANDIRTYGGNDKVYAGGDGDYILLGDGDDFVSAGSNGANTYYGGSGVDTLTYHGSSEGVRVDLKTKAAFGGDANGDKIGGFERLFGSSTGDDVLKGTDGGNIIKGWAGDDFIAGRNGTDRLYGYNDNDTMYGGNGTDFIYGGNGADHIEGDGDNDRMWGNGGADTFHFDKGDDQDIIKDFQNNIDTIEIDGYAPGYNAMSRATQVGSDVVFNFGGGDTLTVEDTTIGALNNDLNVV